MFYEDKDMKITYPVVTPIKEKQEDISNETKEVAEEKEEIKKD